MDELLSKFFEVEFHSRERKLTQSWKRVAQFPIFKSKISFFRVKSSLKNF